VSADSGNEESQILLGLVLCRKKDFLGSKKAFNTVLEKVKYGFVVVFFFFRKRQIYFLNSLVLFDFF